MCTSADSLFTDVEAGLQGVGIVVEAIGSTIPLPAITAIEGGVTIAINGLAGLKSVYDEYEADTTDTTIVSKIQEALKAFQDNLTSLETAAHIDNVTLQGWIAKVVSLGSTVINDIATDILPAVVKAHETNDAMLVRSTAGATTRKLKDLKKAYDNGYDAALKASGFSDVIKKKAHTDFHNRIATHIIGVRV